MSFAVAKTAFSYFYTGEASALAVMLLFIIIGLSMILVRHLGKMGEKYLMAEIELKNLTIDFAGFKAVDNVNLTVKNGEFVVYLGPSGCGKTTTLRCIAGLVKATSGDVLFDGTASTILSASERNIAMVFQFVSLYPHLKIRENIVFPLKARGVARAEIARKLDWVVSVFGLGADLNRYPASLPPGARQKVALARAVIREPAVLSAR